jgi:Flp pilus assembly pilin Flp
VLSHLSVTLAYLRARLGGQQLREAGVTAVEYALMVAIIALLMVAGFYTLFNSVKSKYQDVGNCVATQPAPQDCSPGSPPTSPPTGP